MKRYLFISGLLFIFFTHKIQAQQWPFEFWHEGKIVLEAGDTLRGLVKYDLQQDLLQYKDKQQALTAYTARKVLFFEIFDNSVHKYRQFFSLPYSLNGDYKAPVFFELLEEGKITLLCREVLEYRTYTNPYGFGSYTRQVLVYKYFLLKENGNIESFDVKKSELLAMMGRKSESVENFMKTNKLKVDEKYDLARIIDYYNTL